MSTCESGQQSQTWDTAPNDADSNQGLTTLLKENISSPLLAAVGVRSRMAYRHFVYS